MKIKIALDAGHYGRTFRDGNGKGRYYDNGKVFEEHDFNADVVEYMKELLEKNGNFEVVLLQPLRSNREVSLKERTNKARQENADLVFSVHANAGVKSASGACIFYWHTDSNAKRFAQLWASKMSQKAIGTHGDGTHASMPNSWTNFSIESRFR